MRWVVLAVWIVGVFAGLYRHVERLRFFKAHLRQILLGVAVQVEKRRIKFRRNLAHRRNIRTQARRSAVYRHDAVLFAESARMRNGCREGDVRALRLGVRGETL